MITIPEIAALAHQGQFRRDGVTPYIEHPKKVASFFETGTDKWSIAWLHDVLEDTPMTFDDLREHGVNDDVLGFVEWMTHREEETYFDYIRRIKMSEMATKIKIADIFANLSDTPTETQKERYTKALKILLA